MLGFLRRRSGRGSALGAAVTGIPSRPVLPAPLAPLAPPSVVVPVADVPLFAGPVVSAPPVAEPMAAAPPAASPPVVPAQTGPRIELGFRDGSHAALDPASEEAQALDELARLLAGRP